RCTYSNCRRRSRRKSRHEDTELVHSWLPLKAPVAFTFRSQANGEVAVVRCDGPIVESDALAALDRHVTDLLPFQPFIVFNLEQVAFVDSAGLGRIVRLLNRARGARGDLKLCGVRPNLREVLRITKLGTILAAYETEADAIAAFGVVTRMSDSAS